MLDPKRFNAIAIGSTEAYPDGHARIDENGNITTLGILDAGDILAASTGATTCNGSVTTERTLLSGTVLANLCRVGSQLSLEGILSLTAVATGTLTLRLKLGGVTYAEAVLDADDVGMAAFTLKATVQALGALGKVLLSDQAIAATTNGVSEAPSIEDLDLSVDQAIAFTAQWSAVDAGNTASFLGGVARRS